jgi:2-C-methyl-D-erythritol 2,4-cyclodiphosphate synthase
MRIGQGFDVHRFCKGDFVTLGGVQIPFEFGLEAHSDGDVLLHAICDALLGAACLGDIGQHFPDSAQEYEGISSLELLMRVGVLVEEKGFSTHNIDATILGERPKIATYSSAMRANIAGELQILPAHVNIKATTTEKMGFTGRGEGLAAMAVCTIIERDV